ncbi:MAG: hypothetical protein V1933_08290 [Candidatus Omnitrophota bacterium]
MANKKEHLRQVQINDDAFSFLGGKKPRFIDWAITMVFYMAVHHVEAAFACINGVGHSECCRKPDESASGTRYRLVKSHLGKQIAFHFYNLEQASKSVRYLLDNYKDFYDKESVADFMDKDLASITAAAKLKYDIH